MYCRGPTPPEMQRLNLSFVLIVFIVIFTHSIVVPIVTIGNCPALVLCIELGKKFLIDKRYVLSHNLLPLLGYPRPSCGCRPVICDYFVAQKPVRIHFGIWDNLIKERIPIKINQTTIQTLKQQRIAYLPVGIRRKIEFTNLDVCPD